MLTRLAMPAIFVLGAALAACGKPAAPPNFPLGGTEWGLAGNPAPERFVQFVPEGGQFGGSAGCNQIFGGFTQDGETFTFDRIGTTRMACPPEIMAAETAFLAMLSETRSATINSLLMTLKREDGSTIVELVRRDVD
jgi:heat shock protein HslJ